MTMGDDRRATSAEAPECAPSDGLRSQNPADIDPATWGPLLRATVGERNFDHWFHKKTTLTIDDCTLTVGVGSPFLMSWMQRHFRSTLSAAARTALGPAAEVRFVVDPALGSIAEPSARADAPTAPTSFARKTPPREIKSAEVTDEAVTGAFPRAMASIAKPIVEVATLAVAPEEQSSRAPSADNATRGGRRLADLADFVGGPCNRLPLLAATQVSEAPGTQHNPLYLHGNVGTGKTHLLEGICRRIRRASPGSQVVLLTAEAFANCFTEALRDRSLPAFRQRFRTVDVLLVDDVDFLDGKPMIEEEFLHTFKQLEARGRQVVVSADRHPRLLARLSPELASRFLSGLVCRIENPDSETRKAIVQRRAGRLEADFAPEALAFVSERFTNNVRELEGALNSLAAWHAATNRRVTASVARSVLADLERDCVRIVRLGDVEQTVCRFFGLTTDELRSPARTRTVSQPRMVAMYLARRLTQAAYHEIGQHFGGRNHSTVMAAERRVQEWLDAGTTIRIASQSWPMSELIESLGQRVQAG